MSGTARPTVSILIDNHEYGRFLGEAIDSALEQSWPAVEVIVVDDGSTDDSRAVLARYGGRIDTVLKENGGQASAINAGFRRCRGACVIVLDADDRLRPEIAAAVAEAFAERPEAARVQYRVEVMDEAGRPTGERIPADYVAMPSGDLKAGLVRFNNPTWWPPMSGHAFSARALRRILPMPEPPFRVGADYYLVRASTLCGPVSSIDRVGADYRRHGQNVDLRERLDLDQVRTQIELTLVGHRWLKEFAASLEETDFAPDPSEVADLRFAALCLISKKLEPSRHPLPGETLVGLTRRGMRVARSQTHLPWRVRAMAALWFPALLLAPRGPARALATGYSYPRTRPWLSRFLRRS